MWYLLVLLSMFILTYLWLLSLLGYTYSIRFRWFFVYLIWLSFIMISLDVCSSYFIYCLLLVNSFISMYVLSRSYGVSVYLLIVLFFKVLAEILLFISYGLFLSLDGFMNIYISNVYISLIVYIKLLLLLSFSIYSLLGIFGL